MRLIFVIYFLTFESENKEFKYKKVLLIEIKMY